MSINPTGPKIWPAFSECMCCNIVKNCLGFDTSNETESYGFICRECFNQLLDEWHGVSTLD